MLGSGGCGPKKGEPDTDDSSGSFNVTPGVVQNKQKRPVLVKKPNSCLATASLETLKERGGWILVYSWLELLGPL